VLKFSILFNVAARSSFLFSKRLEQPKLIDELGINYKTSEGGTMNIVVTMGLCVRNVENTVREAIQSVINQDFPHNLMEIIIVDGRSSDKTISIINDYLSISDIQMRNYSDQGNGLGEARQIVVDNARGKYIVWVDGDIVLSQTYVREQVQFMNENHRVGATQGKLGINVTKGFVEVLENLSVFENKHEERNPRAIATRGIYRVEAINQSGGFDKCIRGASEDRDLSYRLWKNGWLLVSCQGVLYHRARGKWSDLWKEYIWWGYGEHYIKHKHPDLITMWRMLPIIRAAGGLTQAFNVYRLTHMQISFLLPFHNFFKASAFCYGFIKSHKEGYGHKMKSTPNGYLHIDKG
jgi:glycosyltransferase involved in cell wall biosynthesis